MTKSTVPERQHHFNHFNQFNHFNPVKGLIFVQTRHRICVFRKKIKRMKKSFFLFLALFSGLFLANLSGQSRFQISGFLHFNDPLDFQDYSFRNPFNSDSVSWNGSFFNNVVPGIALGFWTKSGRTLHEFQYDGKKPFGGGGKGWQYTSDSTGPGAVVSNGRFSVNYGLFYNLLPTSKRLALFPGIGVRPFFNDFNLTSQSAVIYPQNIQNFGLAFTFLPRLMLRVKRGFFVDLTWAAATATLKYETDKTLNPSGTIDESSFKYDLKFINGLARFGLGWRFGYGKKTE